MFNLFCSVLGNTIETYSKTVVSSFEDSSFVLPFEIGSYPVSQTDLSLVCINPPASDSLIAEINRHELLLPIRDDSLLTT